MAPTIIEYPNGSFYLAIGGSGGSRIFPSVFQVILNLDWGLDVGQAIEQGRLHDQLYPLDLDVDGNIPNEMLEYLKQRGHNVTGKDTAYGVMIILNGESQYPRVSQQALCRLSFKRMARYLVGSFVYIFALTQLTRICHSGQRLSKEWNCCRILAEYLCLFTISFTSKHVQR